MREPRIELPDPLPWCKHAAERDAWRMVSHYEREVIGLDTLSRRRIAVKLADALVEHGDYGEGCRNGCDDD